MDSNKHAPLGLLVVMVLCAYGEARAKGSDEIDLSTTLAHAEKHAPQLIIARARAQRGKAEIAAAAPLLPENPEISVSVGPRMAEGGTGVDVQVGISQRLWIAGERGLRREAAEGTSRALRARLAIERWRLRARVRALFQRAVVARQGDAAARRLAEFSEQVRTIAVRRHAAGEISLLKVRVAEVEAAQAKQAKIAAESELLGARLRLAEAIGWSAAAPPLPAGALRKPRRVADVKAIIERAGVNAPRLRAAAAVLASARVKVRLAERRRWPQPTVGLSYGRESDPKSGDTEANLVLFSLGVPLPIWQRNQGERARAAAEVKIAAARTVQLQLTLKIAIAREAAQVNAQADRVVAYGVEILPSLERNLKLLRRSLELGGIDLLALVTAQQRFVRIQRDALQAYADYFDAVARLEALLCASPWSGASGEEKRS